MGKQQVISRFFTPKKNDGKNTNINTNISSSSQSKPSPSSAKSSSPSTKRKRTQDKTPCNEQDPSTDFDNFENQSHKKKKPNSTENISKPKLEENISDFANSEEGFEEEPDSNKTQNPDAVVLPMNPALHRRFVDSILGKYEDNHTSQVSKPLTGKERYTPLEEQVVALKSEYPDILLMIEVGYKFRFFGDDAEVAARVLGIFAHYDHNFMTASIPTFRLHVHVRRLVEAGHKVGIVRQTETAAIKKSIGSNKSGPFTRSLTALYTKATLEAAEDLGGAPESDGMFRINSYLMCVVEEDVLDKKMGNSNCDVVIGFVAVEISTGDVMFGQFKDSITRAELESRLLQISPVELILGRPLSAATEKVLSSFAGPASNVRVENCSREHFMDGGAFAEVLSLYENENERGLIVDTDDKHEKSNKGIEAVMAMPNLVVQALALTLNYLKNFNLEKILTLGATFHEDVGKSEMSLTSNTLQQLEILKNNIDGSESGSLLKLMDHTCTSFGARLFRHWVTHPLCNENMILARLEAVSEFANYMSGVRRKGYEGSYPRSGRGGITGAASRSFSEENSCHGIIASVLSSLGKVPDIERGITRIFHQTATAAEFVSVIHSLLTAAKQLERIECIENTNDLSSKNNQMGIFRVQSHLLRRLISCASSSVVIEHATGFLSALNKDAAVQGDKQNIFVCSGNRFPEVAKCRGDVQMAYQKLDSLLLTFKKQLHLSNIQYLSVSGTTHMIEVPSGMKVPQNWTKVSSTKKTNRYHPPEVVAALDELAVAKEKLVIESSNAWANFLAEFASEYTDFRAAVQALAELDCLHSLAILSLNQGYVKPTFLEDSDPPKLHIKAGRHPVLEATLGDGFVPNDTLLQGMGECCQIITGPNMGGKSCYIRQVALIVIMAQVGSFVPAESLELHVFDSVFTRMGASDSIQHGSSTFFEELSEISAILNKATSCSLVVIDELGRGTSTHDGAAIAYATLQFILKEKKCITLFVTHYPEIAEIKNEFPGKVNPYYVSYLAEGSSANKLLENREETENDNDRVTVSEVSQNITFLYKLVPGLADRSFGLHVARLAQLPDSCIEQAAIMSTKFENEIHSRQLAKSAAVPLSILPKDVITKSICQKEELELTKQSLELEIQPAHDGPRLSEILRLLEFAMTESRPAEGMLALQAAHELAVQQLSFTKLIKT